MTEDYVVIDFVFDEVRTPPSDLPDFDEAKQAWRQNKKKHGHGFEYRCGQPKKDGTPCNGVPYVWTKYYRTVNELGNMKGHSACRMHK